MKSNIIVGVVIPVILIRLSEIFWKLGLSIAKSVH